jgi:outer membrane protein OmpA-like peptidoglycan-associated protein
VISTTGTLANGTYDINGTVTDTSSDSGTWSFALNVQAPTSITSPAIIDTTATGNLDQQLFADGTYIWVTNLADGTVTQILESTGVVQHTINFTPTSATFSPSGIASDGTNVWVTDFNGSAVYEFNIAAVNAYPSGVVDSNNLLLVTTLTDPEPSDITYSGNTVDVTTQLGQTLVQINATTGLVVNTTSAIAGDLNYPRGVSIDATTGNAWVANPGLAYGGDNNDCATTSATQWGDTVSVISPLGLLVKSIPVGNAYVEGSVSGSQPFDISVVGDYAWVTLKCQDAVAKIAISNGVVVDTIALPTGSLPQGVVSDGTNVWVAESGLGQVQEISASTDTITNTVSLGANSLPWAAVFDGTNVWVTNFNAADVVEIGQAPPVVAPPVVVPVVVTPTATIPPVTTPTSPPVVVTPAAVLPLKRNFIVHFGENLSSLTSSDKVIIHNVAVFIVAHSLKHTTLLGYTDPLDTATYNLALGARRAKSVELQLASDLTALGYSSSATTTASRGATSFVEVGLSDSARAKDRRVTIFVS